ncbi:hypothetical protein M378DRAFT_172434 [Amanita muscaria Koide BX008]|uniref:Uncharacterized protein n=1 Tax=Amanita muscaria (strain Koide BX008) TaxID=946122 RepID=A0A0C2WJ91_AMAMK|nr:hypothetical protein M378DRAFT_172434 [Amanita muscaria Koide BX008]
MHDNFLIFTIDTTQFPFASDTSPILHRTKANDRNADSEDHRFTWDHMIPEEY